ncbi:hypothetical protein C2U68_03055 [Methylomonas koyamae]|nr:hypothetical protein C2U68_03055 [Methylomonas koyamae]
MMKISELIELLKTFQNQHGDLPVNVVWEGVKHGVDRDCLYVSGDILFIDGEGGEWLMPVSQNREDHTR